MPPRRLTVIVPQPREQPVQHLVIDSNRLPHVAGTSTKILKNIPGGIDVRQKRNPVLSHTFTVSARTPTDVSDG